MLDYQTLTEFLLWLEKERNCSASTKNQRLSALLSFSKYAQNRDFEAALVFRSSVVRIPDFATGVCTRKVKKIWNIWTFSKHCNAKYSIFFVFCESIPPLFHQTGDEIFPEGNMVISLFNAAAKCKLSFSDEQRSISVLAMKVYPKTQTIAISFSRKISRHTATFYMFYMF